MSEQSPIILHHLVRSRSHRILWLFEELGLDYEIETYQRDPETMRAPASLRAIHPLGKSPVVSMDGFILAESGAIIEALVEREGKLRPALGSEERRRYDFFLHYAEGSLMSPLLVRLITGQLRTKKVPLLIRPIARAIGKQIDGAYTNPEIRGHLAFLEAELSDREFVCGPEFCAADIQIHYPIEAAATRAGLGEHRKLAAYLERLRARPAYARALERGGPVMVDAD